MTNRINIPYKSAPQQDTTVVREDLVQDDHDMSERPDPKTASPDPCHPSWVDLEQVADMALQCGPDGGCIGINEAWARFTGRTLEQERGAGWIEGMHPQDVMRIRLAQERAAAQMCGCQARFRQKRADGGYAWVIATAIPLQTRDGIFDGFLVSAADLQINEAESACDLPYDPSLIRQEFNHRLKNQLMEIEALTALYAASGRDTAQVCDAISGKLAAIRSVHELVSGTGSKLVSIPDLTANLIEASCDKWADTSRISPDRITLNGPDFYVTAKHASCIAMCVHELLLNSRTHGALASDDGTVRICWEIDGADKPTSTVRLIWDETNPSPQARPLHPGVGLRLVQCLTQSELQGTFNMAMRPTGFSCTLTTRIADLTTNPR